jgi:hypothetical protein
LVVVGSDEQLTVRFRYATPSAPNPVFPGFSRYQNVNKEIIDCSDYIKMVQKPRKIKAFRGFLIPKRADIV